MLFKVSTNTGGKDQCTQKSSAFNALPDAPGNAHKQWFETQRQHWDFMPIWLGRPARIPIAFVSTSALASVTQSIDWCT